MTDKELYHFCQEYENLRIERDADGNILIMSPTNSETGYKNLKISSRLALWAEVEGSGLAFDNNTGFTLPSGAMRSPDAAWVSVEKWNQLTQEQKEEFAPVCPDFVLELMSKTDRLKDAQEKMEEWLANGCRLGWLIDPINQKTYIYRPEQKMQTVSSFSEKMNGGNVLKGFELNLTILL